MKKRCKRQYGGIARYSPYISNAIPMTPQEFSATNMKRGGRVPRYNSGGYVNPNSIDTGFDWMQVGEGAMAGAAAGSVVPGWGTLIGGVVGAGAGAVKAAFGQRAAREQQQDLIYNNMANKVRSDQTRLSGNSSVGISGASLYARKGGAIPKMANGGVGKQKAKNAPDAMTWQDYFNPGTYASTVNKLLRYPFEVGANLPEIYENAAANIASRFGNTLPGVNQNIQDITGERLKELLYYNSPAYYRQGEIPRGFGDSAKEVVEAGANIASGAMIGKLAQVGMRGIGNIISGIKPPPFATIGKKLVNKTVGDVRSIGAHGRNFYADKSNPFARAEFERQLERASRPVFEVPTKIPNTYLGKKVVPNPLPNLKFSRLSTAGRPKNFSKLTPKNRSWIYESELPAGKFIPGTLGKTSTRSLSMPTLSGSKEAFKGFGKRTKNLFKKKKDTTLPFTIAGATAGTAAVDEARANFDYVTEGVGQPIEGTLGNFLSNDEIEQEYRNSLGTITPMASRNIPGMAMGGTPNVQTDSQTRQVGAGIQVDTNKKGTDKIKANIEGTPVYLDDEEVIVNDAQGQPVVLSDYLGTADQYMQELAMGGDPNTIAMKYAEIAKRLNPNPGGNGRQLGGGDINDKWLEKYTQRYNDYTTNYGRYSRYDTSEIDDRGQRRAFKKLGRAYDRMGGLDFNDATYFNDRYASDENYSDPTAYASGKMTQFRTAMNSPRTSEQNARAKANLDAAIQGTTANLDAGDRGSKFINQPATQVGGGEQFTYPGMASNYAPTNIPSEDNILDYGNPVKNFNTMNVNRDVNIGAQQGTLNVPKRRPYKYFSNDPLFDANKKISFNTDIGQMFRDSNKTGLPGAQDPAKNKKEGVGLDDNQKALLAQGLTTVGTTAMNIIAANKLANTKFPEFQPYEYDDINVDVNKQLYDRARSNIKTSTDAGTRNIMRNTISSNTANARANAMRANEINAFSDIASKEGAERAQLENANTAAKNRYRSDTNRLKAGYEMAEYGDKIGRIQTGLGLSQNVTTSVDNLITNYKQGKVDDETIKTLATLYDIDISDNPTIQVMLERLKASGITNLKTQFS